MKHVRFLRAGRWAVVNRPYEPQFNVEEGQVMEVGSEIDRDTAEVAVEAGAAELVEADPDEKSDEKSDENPSKPKKKRRGILG